MYSKTLVRVTSFGGFCALKFKACFSFFDIFPEFSCSFNLLIWAWRLLICSWRCELFLFVLLLFFKGLMLGCFLLLFDRLWSLLLLKSLHEAATDAAIFKSINWATYDSSESETDSADETEKTPSRRMGYGEWVR